MTSQTSQPIGATSGKSRAWLAWLSAVSFVVYYFSIQTSYAIVNPRIQQDLAITRSQVGIVAATYTWTYAIGQFFSGALLDRQGARRVLLPAILFVVAGSFVFAKSNGPNMLMLSQVVLALGACAGFVGAGYVGGQWFGQARFSFMFGLVQFSASIASAFSQNVIAWALEFISWRELFTYTGYGGIGLFAIAVLVLRDPKPIAPTSVQTTSLFLREVVSAVYQLARNSHIWIVSVIGGFVFGSMLSMGVVWAPTLLAVQGMEDSHITVAASLIWLGLALGCLIVPRWSDAIKGRKVPMICATALQLTALTALLYLPAPTTSILMALCFLFGVSSAAHMLSFSSAADVVIPERIGTASALVNGTMFLVGGLLLSRPGVRIDEALGTGMKPGIELAEYAALPLVVSLLLALALLFFMKETYPKNNT